MNIFPVYHPLRNFLEQQQFNEVVVEDDSFRCFFLISFLAVIWWWSVLSSVTFLVPGASFLHLLH
jgi:hypothetical protein